MLRVEKRKAVKGIQEMNSPRKTKTVRSVGVWRVVWSQRVICVNNLLWMAGRGRVGAGGGVRP